MVAQFLRLKLTMLRNSVRRPAAQLTGMTLGLLCALALVVLAAASIVALRVATADVARVIIVVFGTVVVLCFLLLPLVFGADDGLDPRRFALLGIRNATLARAIAIAALASVPSAVIVLFALAQIAVWSRGVPSVLVAIATAVLLVSTCVLAARVSGAVGASLLSSRGSRDGAAIALVAVLAVIGPALTLLATSDWQSQGLPVFRRIAAIASWTPFGALWSAPGDAALGRLGLALIKLAIGLVFLALLWLCWRGLVAMMLLRPEPPSHATSYLGLGWFGRLSATPRGVIAARSLSYWARDARYRVSLAAIPIMPVVMVLALAVAGVPTEVIIWIPVPVVCLFLGWTVHNDVAQDGTAFWTHVSASTRGTDDRWGRLAPAVLVGVPVALLGSLATALVTGQLRALPGLIGLSLCLLLLALGVSSVISARFPYPTVHPGDSPFMQPQAVGSSGSVVQSLSLLLILILSSPVVALVVVATVSQQQLWQYLALGAGLLGGGVVLLAGVSWGGRVLERRAPELLAFALQN